MSRIIAWGAPEPTPEQIARRERHQGFRDLANELKTRPGEWALIHERLESTDANIREHLGSLAVYGVRWQFDGRPYGSEGYSSLESTGPYDVYARYDGRFDRYKEDA